MIEAEKIEIEYMEDARKKRFDREEIKDLFRKIKKFFIANRGKYELFENTEEKLDEIVKKSMGPSGNLRAPTLLINDLAIIGFQELIYKEQLASKKED